MQKTILLIEPDPILFNQYMRILAPKYRVLGAGSAQSSIDTLDSDKSVDLIISECNLGQNNGFELLHEIRSHDDWLDLPVIMLSLIPPSRLPTQRLKAYGVHELLYKPQITPHILRQRVSEVLEQP